MITSDIEENNEGIAAAETSEEYLELLIILPSLVLLLIELERRRRTYH
jgi:hypothetical protein